ncbi:Carboxypeptidase regulatory-like domain-containing protein [Andreprevotia lacus DSM 23236]|jgi:hypothetical protein|uniref:Carboxypeptidase regulatory-like domain-containing protein n=1 Tax=Andreprevotia lacus DSM 23236 TaxID=1121001 RepID=A0A1W1X5R7_9NEIS|nr:carboxypeptidase-like regulatory domain-containing protein [Andreprevotia lacus]SMC19133.1 Carboxypeptidase regulatory-like domain-containing protein [Andreprevotia lacus DSM 23236]
MKLLQTTVLKAAALACLLVAPAYAADRMGAADFISGGVGDEELAQIRSQRGDYNVHVLLTEKSGAYLSGVHVVVSDRNGQVVIDTETRGPYFYARLPAGQYTLVASSDGHTQTRKLNVGHGKGSDMHLAL